MPAPLTPVPLVAARPLDPIGQQRQLFRSRERKVFSQFNEDGILELIFDRIGPGGKRFVEFGIGNGVECNTAHLSIHHGWGGLLLEGNPRDAAKATAYYAGQASVGPGQVRVVEAFVTAADIDGLIVAHAPPAADGERLDLLSIDIDGNDAWVWRAISSVRPRVVVVEYNAAFGYERSVTVPYDPAFERFRAHPSGVYLGASLSALARIGHDKGYALVACESHGVNAFFVDRALAAAAGFIELPPDRAYYAHTWWTDRYGQTDQQFALIAGLPLVDV